MPIGTLHSATSMSSAAVLASTRSPVCGTVVGGVVAMPPPSVPPSFSMAMVDRMAMTHEKRDDTTVMATFSTMMEATLEWVTSGQGQSRGRWDCGCSSGLL